jgi:hypothetical protein
VQAVIAGAMGREQTSGPKKLAFLDRRQFATLLKLALPPNRQPPCQACHPGVKAGEGGRRPHPRRRASGAPKHDNVVCVKKGKALMVDDLERRVRRHSCCPHAPESCVALRAVLMRARACTCRLPLSDSAPSVPPVFLPDIRLVGAKPSWTSCADMSADSGRSTIRTRSPSHSSWRAQQACCHS